ncbi:MAG: hypothetical protein ACK5FE_10085 [Cyanobacteriota bacterium]|jgi:hypothetical protein
MNTEAPYDQSLKSLYSRLVYIHPSLEPELKKIFRDHNISEEGHVLSRLIKKFGSQSNCAAMIICIHYIIRNHQRLRTASQEKLYRLVKIEQPSLESLQQHIETIKQLTSGQSDYATRIISIHSATLVETILKASRETPSPHSVALGACLEMSITPLRLINPSFVENSGVYAAIALLGHEDIHFCVEFVEKMKNLHRNHHWIHEIAEIIGNRYGATNLAANTNTEPPTRQSGYMKDIEILAHSCRRS